MRNRSLFVAFLICVPVFAAEKAAYDSNGRITALLSGGEDIEVTSSLVAVLPNAKRIPLQLRVNRRGVVRQGRDLAWNGDIELPDGGRGRMELKSVEDASGVRYTSTVTAQTALDLEAVEFVLDLSRPVFVGGQVTPSGAAALPLSAVKPESTAFFRGETAGVNVRSQAGDVAIDIGFGDARQTAVIDRWDPQGRSYQVRVALKRGPFTPGSTATLTASLRLSDTRPAPGPVRLSLDTSKPRYEFDGFGANYCWNNASPVAVYNRKNLKIAWGRMEMKMLDWDKQRTNPGPALRTDFETMRYFKDNGIPFVVSIWWLPERLYTDPYMKSQSGSFRLIDPEKWDEVLELLGSYLLYAKTNYGVEPDLFSFNEANKGVYVGLTPQTHMQAIRRIGAYFQKIGLKTRMLLGDATGPRDTHQFVLEAAADPEAMQFVGAVGFHTWGEGTPEQYAAWGDVAEWLKKPLLVTELGVDGAGYYTRSWDSYHYGLREARLTQQLIQYARPQGTQYWQFTNDYALVRVLPDGTVEPTSRFWLMKQFTDLTPQKSTVLTTASNQQSVLFTAFRRGGNYALHILNLGAGHTADLEGLPDAEWEATGTTEVAGFKKEPGGRSQGGKLRLTLPARSLVTLTSAPGEQRAAR